MVNTLTICECFARDGLQHEPVFVPTADKIDIIDRISAVGFPRVEATSYSNPAKVPAFADASAVLGGIGRAAGVHYKATCANEKAVERALADLDAGHGASELSLLISATESHSRRNLASSREEQWQRVERMAARAAGRARLVGVVSVAFGCPFEGRVDPGIVLDDIARFGALGVSHVALADTTGLAVPPSVRFLFAEALRRHPQVVPIAHFHDSRGTALANCWAALEAGCTWFDCAIGGIGGHPAQIAYGGGYTGNAATEDLVAMFEAAGVTTGLDLDKLMEVSRRCEALLGRELNSMVARSGPGFAGRPDFVGRPGFIGRSED